MGGAFSCSSSACHNRCVDMASIFPKDSSSCKFSAEIFKLSENHQQWTKVHPRVLSVTVSRKLEETGSVLELNASDLENQQTFSLPIPQDSEIKRYSNRFVYWKANSNDIFALNVVSGSDVDRLFLVASPASSLSTSTTSGSCVPTVSPRVSVHVATILTIRHGIVVENLQLTFTKSILLFESPNSLRVLDEHENCLFTTQATECVVSLNQTQLVLCLSFPSRALVVQFAEVEPMRTFCSVVLNESSMHLAASREFSEVLAYLQHRLDLVSHLVNDLPYHNANGKTKSFHKNSKTTPKRFPKHISASPQTNRTYPPHPNYPSHLSTYSVAEVLYTLKYMLIYRIASWKNLLPYSDFVNMVFPSELRTMVSSSSDKQYIAHFIHLSCILHSSFAIQKHLESLTYGPINLSKFIVQRTADNYENPKFHNGNLHKQNVYENKLSKVVTELVQTEEMFVNDLCKLLNQYIIPAELTCLDCVRELHRTHSHFLDSLRDASGDIYGANSDSSSIQNVQIKDVIMRISALFINKCTKFKVYSEFASAHLLFHRIQKENQLLSNTLNLLNVRGQQNDSIESLLIKPIQRILKYPLFLAQIQEHCSPESVEHSQCSQALDRMQMLANYVNEMTRLFEDYGQQLHGICLGTELNNQGIHTVDMRDLLMFAQLKIWRKDVGDYVDCVAFVFKFFIILLEKPSKDTTQSTFLTVVLPLWMVDVTEPDVSSMHYPAQTNAMHHFFCLVYFRSPTTSSNQTTIENCRTVYYLSCCHVDIKEHFIRSVKKGLRACIKQNIRPTSGQSSQSDWGYASGR
ncbi:rhoGEF domain-containing protein [Ditylenchus destructor]|uniref:RhoGEF domain-containing protein n=1 Tax=Ditylenchus destructor TaxID=166010 RepID=A0AAD4R0L3_9BILA|nr:rhoGEF domain-containing protein [Ditylenchus destructor]